MSEKEQRPKDDEFSPEVQADIDEALSMSADTETYQIPRNPQNQEIQDIKDDEVYMPQAAAASRRQFKLTPAGKVAAVVTAAAALAGTQTAVNAINDENRRAAIQQEYQQKQEFLDNLEKLATQPADPLDIQEAFSITDENVRLIDYANGITINLEDYQDNKEFIDYTILESSLDQGVYHIGDMFAVTKAELDGKNTYIVQPVSEDTQLPTN